MVKNGQLSGAGLTGTGKERHDDKDVKDYFFRKGKKLQERFNLKFAVIVIKFGDRDEGITDVDVSSHYKRKDYNGNINGF